MYSRPGGDGLLAQYGDCTAYWYVIKVAHCLADIAISIVSIVPKVVDFRLRFNYCLITTC